jgi:hypothetical protein
LLGATYNHNHLMKNLLLVTVPRSVSTTFPAHFLQHPALY